MLPLRCVGALLSGFLLSLAFEPVAAAWLVPFCVAGFVLALRGLAGGRAVLVSVLFATAFFYPLIDWMLAVGRDAWLGLAGVQVAYFALLGPVVARAQRWRGGPVWVALAWLAVEVVRTPFPWSGFPWGRLGFAVVDTPLAEALPWVGVHGTSLLLVLAGAVLASTVARLAGLRRGPRPRPRAALSVAAPPLVVLVLLALPALLPWRDVVDPDTRGTAVVAVVQGGVPGRGDDVLLDGRQLTRNHVDATLDLADRVAAGEAPAPDLVVWPENSTTRDPFAEPVLEQGIDAAVAAIGRPVLVGALTDGPREGTVRNQGIVWEPSGDTSQRYDKWHPVAFGEYIPWRSLFTGFVERLDLVPRDMVAGDRRTPLPVGPALVADAICYDVGYDDGVYAQVRQGADLTVTQTSNALFVFTDQIDQQFAMSRVRALETGRWMLVASVNGISGIIRPDGTVTRRAPELDAAVLLEEVDLVSTRTPAVFWAPWLGRAAVAAATVVLLGPRLHVLWRRRRRTPGADGS